jgi:cytochrome c556
MTETGTCTSGTERVPPLNPTDEEAAYLWEMMKREVGKEELQNGEDPHTVESLHTKIRRITREVEPDTDRSDVGGEAGV